MKIFSMACALGTLIGTTEREWADKHTKEELVLVMIYPHVCNKNHWDENTWIERFHK